MIGMDGGDPSLEGVTPGVLQDRDKKPVVIDHRKGLSLERPSQKGAVAALGKAVGFKELPFRLQIEDRQVSCLSFLNHRRLQPQNFAGIDSKFFDERIQIHLF